LNEEYKQVDCWFNECKVKLEGRDLEEKGILPENVRNHEVELRMSKQKLSEKEEELQQVQRVFNEHIRSKDRMVADLEHQLEDLKKLMKAKDECARQQQMEAIRQLTMRVHDLTNVNNDLRDILSNSSSCCGLC
jgi:vacuolar-type H+-ATPase catalytic subunit A/Vma1